MIDTTIVFFLYEGKIALAAKRRGFGKEFLNGYGGKLNVGEALEDAACREVLEESGFRIAVGDLKKVGVVDFYFPHNPSFDQRCHWYFVSGHNGPLKQSDEMEAPLWYPTSSLPYTKMWPADRVLLPMMLDGHYVDADVIFKKTGFEKITFRKPAHDDVLGN